MIKEEENNQLSRFISLVDPNVEIIYITPYPLGKEISSTGKFLNCCLNSAIKS